MPAAVKIELHGLEQVKREMAKLEPRIQKNVLRGGVRKVAADIRNQARSNVDSATGKLKRNIVSAGRRGRRGQMRASVIIRDEGGRDDKRNSFYWRFVEFGHFDRAGKWISGTHFLTRAYEWMRDRVDQTMTNYMRPRIDKALKGP